MAAPNRVGEKTEIITIRMQEGLLKALDGWASEKMSKGRKSDRSDQMRICIAMRKIAEIKEGRS